MVDADAFRSERLVYRAVKPSDVDWIDENIHGDAEIFTMIDPGIVRPQRRKQAEFIYEMFEKAILGVMICLPVEDDEEDEKEDDAKEAKEKEKEDRKAKKADSKKPKLKAIGMLNIGAPGVDMAHHRATNMGMGLAREYWGKGYGTEALLWALHWAFHRGNFHRVGLMTAGFNTRAQKMYEKVGFVDEGVTRDMIWVEGKYWDVKRYGILEDEWRAKYQTK
jgi:RimJ/RimL family protein N-acetyltransferase